MRRVPPEDAPALSGGETPGGEAAQSEGSGSHSMSALTRMVLAALSLFLLAATPLPNPQASPVPTPENPSVGREKGDYVKQHSRESPKPDMPAGLSSPNGARGTKDNQDNSEEYSGWLLLFTAVMALATVFLAIFNWQLVRVSRDMHVAATKSAELAELALLSDRPHVVVTGMTHKPFDQDKVFHAEVSMKNIGKGPALIEEILVDVSVEPPAEPVYVHMPSIRLFVPVLEINGTDSFDTDDMSTSLNFIQWAYEEMSWGRQKLLVWGRIAYKDSLEQKYETGFGWELQIDRPFDNLPSWKGRMVLGPKAYNYDRKCERHPKQI
jgi:hypothetical protein